MAIKNAAFLGKTGQIDPKVRFFQDRKNGAQGDKMRKLWGSDTALFDFRIFFRFQDTPDGKCKHNKKDKNQGRVKHNNKKTRRGEQVFYSIF